MQLENGPFILVRRTRARKTDGIMVEQTLFVIFKRGLWALRVLFLLVGAEKNYAL